MNAENFILKRPKPRIKNGGKGEVIRITDEAYAILAGFSAESGKSMNFIASEMIKFASERTVIEDED